MSAGIVNHFFQTMGNYLTESPGGLIANVVTAVVLPKLAQFVLQEQQRQERWRREELGHLGISVSLRGG